MVILHADPTLLKSWNSWNSRTQVAYQEAMALKRQEELIREEASERAGIELKAKRSGADKKRRGKNMWSVIFSKRTHQ